MTTELIPAIIIVILSLILCFAGYRLKRIAFAILWFIIGISLTQSILPSISSHLGLNDFWLSVLPYAIGLLFSLIGLSIERLCVFLLALVGTVMVFFQYQPEFSVMTLVIAVAIGVVVGIICVAVMKPAIILLTSYLGAHSLALYGVALVSSLAASANLGQLSDAIGGAPYYVVLGVIFALGAIFQFKNTKHIG